MLQIHCIPAFSDNYFWLIQPDSPKPDAYIIDPGDPEPVKQTLQAKGLHLKGILLTHHHHDHVDGAQALANEYNLAIYGPDSPRMPQVTHKLREGDCVPLGSQSAKVLALAGHTLDHIGYLLEPTGSAPRLFSGDTLFAAGCGRLFDGTAPLLYQALQKIASLPDDTLIYAAHEYTLSNLKFARWVEPDNTDIIQREKDESLKRSHGRPTLPTTVSLEKRTNPFLRCHLGSLKARAEAFTGTKLDSNVEIFASLRRAKDQF